jgi:hypothetical protein
MKNGRYRYLDIEDLPKNGVKKEYHDKKANASKTKAPEVRGKEYETA